MWFRFAKKVFYRPHWPRRFYLSLHKRQRSIRVPLAPFISLSDNVLDLEMVGESTISSGELILWLLRVLRSLPVSTIARDSRTYHINGALKIVGSLWSLHLGISTDHFTILVAAYISLVICERFRNRSRPSIYSNCYMLTISPSPDLDSWSGIGTACLQECRLDDQSSIECMAPKKNKQVMSFWPQHWAQIRHLLRNKPTQDWCPWVSKIYSAAKVTSEKLFGYPTSICVT